MSGTDKRAGLTEADLEALVRELAGAGRAEHSAAVERLAGAAQLGDGVALDRLLALAARGPEEGIVRVLGALGGVQQPEVLVFLLQRKRVETSRNRLKSIRRAIHRLTACRSVLEGARKLAGESLPELYGAPPRIAAVVGAGEHEARPSSPVGSSDHMDAVRMKLLTRLPTYRVELLESWGMTSGIGKVARIAQLLESYLLAAAHRAAAATHKDPAVMLRAVAGEDARFARASMGHLVALLMQFYAGDMPDDVRAVVEDVRSDHSTIGRIVMIRNSVLHAERVSPLLGGDEPNDLTTLRDEFIALARRLENMLRWKSSEWSMAHLRVETCGQAGSPATGTRCAIDEGLAIGRLPTCDVTIEEELVSRRHARLEVRHPGIGDIALVDASTHGSFVNDARVDKQAVLRHRDLLRIGPVRFRFLAHADG